MWQRPGVQDDPFVSHPAPPPNITFKWANRVGRPSRFLCLRVTPLKAGILLCFIGSFFLIKEWVSLPTARTVKIGIYNATVIPQAVFQPPETGAYRIPDTIDTFQMYKFRDTCNVSSLDLHAPFSPLCRTRKDMLVAMSSGGRIGRDAPYMPRGCDMRWFSTEEVCEILGRFDRVLLVGDSMLRHITGSINLLVRKDIGYGAVTDWNFSLQERRQCFCNEQFDVKACSVQGIYKTADVLVHSPESLSCKNTINVISTDIQPARFSKAHADVSLIVEEIVRYPMPTEEIVRLKASLGTDSTEKKAIILGHGLWSNLELQKSLTWLDAVLHTISATIQTPWHGLFVTPNASGRKKPDEWIVTQGNKALMLYEEAMQVEARKRGLEHLGTWNMSIQANKFDGVHLDMKGNLVKAMMVMNWLNMIPHS